VLDVGCGTGSLAFAVAERAKAGRVTGIDFSEAYIGHARQKNRENRIDFRVGDACALPFEDASFDRVLSLLVLHFVPRPERAVAEMRRVARPGSLVAAAVWDVRGGLVANRIFFDTAATADPRADERRGRNYTRPMTRPGELAQAWRAAGFENVADAMLTIRMDFSSFEDYWTPYLGKDGPGAEYIGALDEGDRAALTEKVRLAYLDGEPDGPRSYAATAWAVKGRVPL
jgi:ubiquinone/menaquinone biosynthesis C-methylase UbiE